MRALLSAASFYPEQGGPARSVPQLASALGHLGVDVGIWAPDGSAKDSPLLEGIQNVVFLAGPAKKAWHDFGLPDVLHDNGIWRGHHFQLARLASASNVARVVSPRGMLEPWALRNKPIRKNIAWWSYQRRALNAASVLHATAESEAEQLKELGLRRSIRVIPNGVNLPAWDRVLTLCGNLDATKNCLFMSRLHPKKGLPLLLDAWAKLKPKEWRLEIAGPDENGHQAEVEDLVHRLGLGAHVRFLGPLEGELKSRTLAKADLMVLPTHSENFGIVVAEALAHGCPVITTHGAPWKLLQTEACGWWVPISSEAIASALREAMSLSRVARHKMGLRGRIVVEREFAWPPIAEGFLQVYEEAISLRRDTRFRIS